MSKFKKILVISMTLIVALTVFAVVSVAAAPAAEPKAVNVGGFRLETTFESWSVGDKFGTYTSGTTGGIKVQEAYPGGNKFLQITGTSGSTATLTYNTFFGGKDGKTDYSIRETYKFANYPIAVVDMDIMTPNGDWGYYAAGNGGNNAGFYIRPYQGSSQKGSLFKQINFGDLGLPTTPYVWYHVTVIYEYSTEVEGSNVVEYVTQKTYVNGKPTTSSYCNGKIKMSLADSHKLWCGSLYIKSSRYEAASIQCIDNIEFTYCEAGYDVSKLPTAIYNENWKSPYTKTVAQNGIRYYDDLSKALDEAKNGDTVQLFGDAKDKVFTVNKTISIDTRKCDAEYNIIPGEYYEISTTSTELVSSNVGGVIKFEWFQNSSVQVYWDDCPGKAVGGECRCPDLYLNENGEHLLYQFVPSMILDNAIAYPFAIPEFPIINGNQNVFKGWSLTQGGEVVEDLGVITSDHIDEGWISLYPVYEVVHYDPAYVTFTDFDGNVILTLDALQNVAVATPVVPLGDGYRALTNAVWTDQDGEVLGNTLGSKDTYVFTPSVPAEPSYVGKLSVAMMNMSFYTGFEYNLYLPKTDDVTFVSVNGESLSEIVYIDGDPYYVYTVLANPTSAFDDNVLAVKYVVADDGRTYTVDVPVNAYLFATEAMSSDAYSAEQKNAISALVKYIEALYEEVAYGEELPEQISAKFASFYEQYGPVDYITEYPDAEKCEINADAAEFIQYAYFRISMGSRVALAIDLTDAAVALGYSVKLNGAECDTVENFKTFYNESVPVYMALTNPVYEIEIVDSEGETVASSQFSIASYIIAMEEAEENADVMKALYTLGKAIIAVGEAEPDQN